MKVLFYSNIPSPYRVEFFNLLAKKCDLTVAYERRKASNRDSKWSIPSDGTYEVIFLKGLDYSDDFSLSLEIIKLVRKRDYDILVVGGYASATQAMLIRYLRFIKIPFVLSIDGGFIKPERKLKYLIKKSLVSQAGYCLSTGKKCDEFLMHYGANRSTIYHYSFACRHEADILKAPVSVSEKKEYKEQIGVGNKKMVLSVGQPIYRKGFDVLINAMKNDTRHDICTVIVGGEPYAECLEELKDAKDADIRFIPFKTKEELSAYYKAADVFAFPTREDIWGLVINEAMSFGLPIVTTDRCNAGDELVAEGKNGYIVPSDDPNALYDAIINVLYKCDGESFSLNSLSRIRPYNLEHMADEHISMFEEIAGETR